ncbi:tetratricopeptide repeat protein [Planctomicrobium sp. SH664]|uniref:tetratricopeptide repeat protein n=1 Tax=Planctomicrobium sp. SH664 TaxID=3448125 RepID=UPI003F5C79DE
MPPSRLPAPSLPQNRLTPTASQQESPADQCRRLLLLGQLTECERVASEQIAKGGAQEDFYRLRAEALFAQGKYDDALKSLQEGLRQFTTSIRLRWVAMQVAPYTEHADLVSSLRQEIGSLVQTSPWRYSDVENLCTLGQFLLAERIDARQVQDAFFQRARRNNPQHRAPQLALANLALDKRDFALAADLFRPASEMFPNDPEILFGLSRALAESDAEESGELLQRVLKINPHFIPALLVQAHRLIDGEQYDAAVGMLDQVLQVNPWLPDALALKSVIAQLQGDQNSGEALRTKALSRWKTNPQVDYLIGLKLSQKYRFREGSAAQRQALAFQSDFLPSQKQLAQDLLRLGQEAEGWQLADRAYQQDEYDIASYNLVTLRDELSRFRTIEQDGFIIRMDAHEADVYGDRVVALLGEARRTLCAKYDVELQNDTLVEIFPKPADFAVRTFGIPAAGGYLGVCFGDVITAKSPASQGGQPVNWESVLWHEFAHVITLNKTHNRMPRWLSEGISVYEERLRDPSWGERMTPEYRQLILDGKFKPIGQLSQAFLSSQGNLLFAYYESSMAVEHIVDRYGLAALLAILNDLGAGVPINDAIERHTAPLAQLEEEFATSLRQEALLYGWAVDWSPNDVVSLAAEPDAVSKLVRWAKDNPRNYNGLKLCAALLRQLREPALARQLLEQATGWFPLETGSGNAFLQLAELQREQGDFVAERETLRRLVAIDDDAATALLRLIELDTAAADWPEVREDALRLMAIRPLIAAPHVALAEASEKLQDPVTAISALQSRLFLPNPDIAGLNYRLAILLHATGRRAEAKRHLLQSIEEAPQHRAALQFYLQLREEEKSSPEGS